MQIDKTTLNDLSIFAIDEQQSVFHHINFTRTVGGKDWLKHFVGTPLPSEQAIRDTQKLLKRIMAILNRWPITITNGTVMVLEKFYDTAINEIPQNAGFIDALLYKIFSGPDHSLVKYSVIHFSAFIKGLNDIAELLNKEDNPPALVLILHRMGQLMDDPLLQKIIHEEKNTVISNAETLRRGYFFHRRFKEQCIELIEIYSKLDAWYSMAAACRHFDYCFPEFTVSEKPLFSSDSLFHPLLPTPVTYDETLTPDQNFLFLTGANMAGKSTFIKAVGVGVYMAHIGMGVPAKKMHLSFFDGLLSNIQVVDNIIQGESYFFNEVQRIRKTIEKISDGKKWLILIDELFKGTNVQDAMKCSTTVIEGLRKIPNTLFILSTHLYEIGAALQQYSNIQFRYFETEVKDDELLFSYQLKNGISNDRLGYLILKREGVVEMLQKL